MKAKSAKRAKTSTTAPPRSCVKSPLAPPPPPPAHLQTPAPPLFAVFPSQDFLCASGHLLTTQNKAALNRFCGKRFQMLQCEMKDRLYFLIGVYIA